MTEDQLRELIGCLQGQEYVAELEDGKIKISANIEAMDIVLWCSLSKHFPYEIPAVVIDKESKQLLPKMPNQISCRQIHLLWFWTRREKT